jgi:hypothetical protein
VIAGLIVYVILATVLVIWSRLPTRARLHTSTYLKKRIDYVVIPSFLLSEWVACYPDLLIFELRTDDKTEAQDESVPGSLPVASGELPHLLKWLPPHSTVVFADGNGRRRLAAEVEETLLQVGIDTVYLLDRMSKFPEAVTWNQVSGSD